MWHRENKGGRGRRVKIRIWSIFTCELPLRLLPLSCQHDARVLPCTNIYTADSSMSRDSHCDLCTSGVLSLAG